MTTTITTTTSSIVSMATDDVIYVATTGSIIKTAGGAAIQSSSAVPVQRASVVIDGLVARLAAPQKDFTAAVVATAFSEGDSGHNSFSIGRTGIVRSNTDGFILRDADDTVDNFGLIDVQGDAITMSRGGTVINAGSMFAANAIIVDGPTAVIENSGQIISMAGAILSVSDHATVTNSGSITGVTGITMQTGVQTLSNTGSIIGHDSAIDVTGLTNGRIQSTGALHATAVTGTALLVSGSNGLVITLSGDITAGANGIFTEKSINLRISQSADISAGTSGIKMLGANGLRMDNAGTVVGGTVGISLAGNNMAVKNSGRIDGVSGNGVQGQGDGFTLHNTGNIEGAAGAVSFTGSVSSGGSLVLDNGATGVIHGGTQGVLVAFSGKPGANVHTQIHNAGEIAGILAGIQISGMPMSLHNSGSISAVSGPAIVAGGVQSIFILNTGTIETALPLGTKTAIAINLSGQGGGVNLVQNSGEIVGTVVMGDRVSTVQNHGYISGDVNLGLGNDGYDGRGGHVTGAVLGFGGNDTLTGGADIDFLFGGNGLDRLRGGGGDDLLQGGAGRDNLTGNSGADTFVFARATEVSQGQSQDHITDFESGVDVINFSFGASKSFIASGAFTGHAGEIRYARGAGMVQGDMDGDRIADFTLILDNHAKLTSADFGL